MTADQSGSQVASDGSLEVAWYLDTTVIYPNVTPADGAGLLISDRNGNLLSSIKSGPDGRTPRQEITEYIRTWNSTAYFTPLSLNASKDGLARNLSVNLNQNLDLTLTLGDVTAPSVRFASPANNTLLNRTSFRFTGTASDDQGVASVRLRAGSGEWVTAGGTTEWNATLDLLEGENLIVAEASDAEGNTALAFLSVRVDSLPPVVEITSPAPGLLVNTTSVELSGRTEPGCTVLVQGEAAPFYLGQFSATVALQEGPNTIVVSARDAAGNVGAASVNITRDTIAPSLTLTAPRNGEITGRAIVNVSGTAEATAALYVNEALLPRSGAFFAVEVMLSDGVNNVSVRAVDAAGNQATILARVILDRTPPPITLELKNGTISQVALLTVAGRTEPGAALSVNGVPVAVAGDGNFSTKVSLRPGPNQIRVEATDPFGNPASLDRTVTYEQPARPKPPVVGEPEPTINPAIPVGIGIIIGFVLMAALLFRGRPPVPAGDDRKSGSLPSGREP